MAGEDYDSVHPDGANPGKGKKRGKRRSGTKKAGDAGTGEAQTDIADDGWKGAADDHAEDKGGHWDDAKEAAAFRKARENGDR